MRPGPAVVLCVLVAASVGWITAHYEARQSLPVREMQALISSAARFGWRCHELGGKEDECVIDVAVVISGKIGQDHK